MRYLMLLIALLILSGCNEKQWRYTEKQPINIGDVSTQEQSWVTVCIRDANPMSDEEPEDMIRQCARTAEGLFRGSSKVPGVIWGITTLSDGPFIPCSELPDGHLGISICLGGKK